MSFPDSIRLDPIRLPRPTILRESPIFDISSSGYTHTVPYPREAIRVQVTPSQEPFTFPQHLRVRRLGDVHLNTTNDELFTHATSSATTTDVNQIVTDQIASLTSPENRDDQPTLQVVSHDIARGSAVPESTLETTLALTSEIPAPVMKNSVSVTSNLRMMNARALCSNPFLGYQRFVFIISKYPALAIAIVALWNVKGRGEYMHKSTSEDLAFYSALTTAGIVLVSQILLHTNHYYSYKKARVMSYLYHISMVLAFCAAVTCVVFASINFYDIRQTTDAPSCPDVNSTMCFTNQERATHQAVLLGGGGMIIFLALAAFVYGAIGMSQMKRRLADEYEQEARLSAYENRAFQY